jgi:hypothetical protein
VVGELSLVWLLAASIAASFLPRGVALTAHHQAVLLQPSALGGIAVALIGLAGCAGLWWLLSHELLSQLALAACALIALALVLPGGLTPYFLPPPLGLLAAAFLISRFPDHSDDAPE